MNQKVFQLINFLSKFFFRKYMSELIANGQVGFREFEDKLKTVCRFSL